MMETGMAMESEAVSSLPLAVAISNLETAEKAPEAPGGAETDEAVIKREAKGGWIGIFSFRALTRRWELEIREMEDLDWEAALMFPQELAIRSRLRLIQFKILGKAQYPECLRCRTRIGDFIHTIWGCPVIQDYWTKIVGGLQGVLMEQILLDPKFILLGIPNDVDLPRARLLFCNLGLVVAKRDITRLWGSEVGPEVELW
ncbi:hypothetical protein NDU88_003223 [Pleurodeles waltl]|uniref:Reverse transcriptase n=1 Tax=Pleurodeles waltl TaxID=8319 RepID=A0AAV7PD72_PLEWA|nr:hypothetical protein NDU88_003223 [Pleurodeles waltl]